MFNNPIFKRIFPFAITLGLGLFIASFFVSIAPTFKSKKNKCGKRHEMRMLKYEKERLELENKRLKMRLEESENMMLLEAPLPPPAPIAPMAK